MYVCFCFHSYGKGQLGNIKDIPIIEIRGQNGCYMFVMLCRVKHSIPVTVSLTGV